MVHATAHNLTLKRWGLILMNLSGRAASQARSRTLDLGPISAQREAERQTDRQRERERETVSRWPAGRSQDPPDAHRLPAGSPSNKI